MATLRNGRWTRDVRDVDSQLAHCLRINLSQVSHTHK